MNTDKTAHGDDALNNHRKKLCGMLGLAKKAGRIISGTDMVCEAVRTGKAKHIYIAGDASRNTNKRLINCCTYYEVPYSIILPCGTELAHAIGKTGNVAAAAVTDIGFTMAINKIIDQTSKSCKADAISAGGAVYDTKSEVQDQ